MLKKTTLMILLLQCCFYAAVAQQALDATGGHIAVSNNLFVDYAVGQVATATNGTPGTSGYFTAGVIQPSFGVSATGEEFEETYYLRAVPNPVGQSLTIDTDYRDFQQFHFTNVLGQRVADGSFGYKPLDVSRLAAGTYFLTLTSSADQFSKTIKIIKQ